MESEHKDNLSPADQEALLLEYFHQLNDLGRNLALVALHITSGHPALLETSSAE